MIIDIKDAGEFTRLLEALIGDLVDAAVHAKLHADLAELVEPYHREFAQSRTFWSLTFRAHEDASVFHLCRAFDQESKAVSLRNLVDTIKSNLWMFDEAGFRTRLAGNPFVDSLAATPRRPDAEQLERDILSVSDATNPLVKKLMVWRNNVLAHRSRRQILGTKPFHQEYPLPYAEIDCLIDLGLEIVNRYSQLFQATVYSRQIIGHDDYRSVLAAVRKHIESCDAEIDAQRRRVVQERD